MTINKIESGLERFINEKETFRYLGYGSEAPDAVMLEELEECKALLLRVMHPKYCYEIQPIQKENDGIQFGQTNLILTGTSIQKHLAGCELAALSCATLSKEADILIEEKQKENMLHALLIDALANAAIEEVRMLMEEEIAGRYPQYQINFQFGIGYGDLPLALQSPFAKTLDIENNLGVSVTKSCLLHPLKSVSGIIGLRKKETMINRTENRVPCGKVACDVCSQKSQCVKYEKTNL